MRPRRPRWARSRPTAEETTLRRALREAYEELGAATERRQHGVAWERVLPLASQLRDVEEARRAALEETQEEWDAADDPADG